MATPALSILMTLFTVLVPTKMWYAPNQPVSVTIKSDKDVTLELTTFEGKPLPATGSADVAANASVDVKTLFPDSAKKGAYILYALAKGTAPSTSGAPKDFLGTPLVIEVLADPQGPTPDASMVSHVEPLRYAVMSTEAGRVTMAFYFDDAPHPADTFLQLASEGYFDGLTFHRIIPSFVIQGGDPIGTGTGGPGFHLDAEFNNRQHQAGVLSMARNGDPIESENPGAMPRSQFANSAGSQFFICLDYAQTQQLDHRYTAFGKVTDGMDAVKKIAATPLSDPRAGKPANPVVIQKIEVFPVTSDKDPYRTLDNSDAGPAK
jgi:cyclophilin family peptidyl-prolyl cis-trans isomerase